MKEEIIIAGNKCSMKQMGEKVKQSGTGDKGHALSLSFCI